jgi:DNA repair photolyase
VAQRDIRAEQKGNRPDCACHLSRDIGAYDTCPHGCVYCYAVLNRDLAQRHYREHDPESEYLFKPDAIAEVAPADVPNQLPLL